jgi:hypothetical protein
MTDDQQLAFGSDDLRLPDSLRGPLRAHLNALRDRYHRRGWGGPVGFGERLLHHVIPIGVPAGSFAQ